MSEQNETEEASEKEDLGSDTANISEQEQNESINSQSSEKDIESQLSELNSKYLYAMAELDNTRKRHIKERSDLIKYAGESMARDLLEVLDDLERAASQSPDIDSNTIIEGINLISNRMRTLFERYGIKSEDSVGNNFDPKKHEALTVAPSSPEDSGKIIQQISKSYFFKDKLLRPAQVIVGSGETQKEEIQ